jgi:dTDP-4-dehydrorhamnose reductase
MANRKILQLAAKSQLAHDLMEGLAAAGHTVIGLTREQADLTDAGALRAAVAEHNPDWVINCGAWHKVDHCEATPAESFAVNATGVRDAAAAAHEQGAGFVHFSTDYVFDRAGLADATEADPPNPGTTYAISKLAGEHGALIANPRCYVLRVCGLFGFAGNSGKGGNFVETMLRLAKEKGEVTVVDNQVVAPTHTRELVPVVEWLLARDRDYGVYHATADGETSWHGFATEIFKQCGVTVPVRATTTAAMALPATRPARSILTNARLAALGGPSMKHWKDGLRDYLIRRGHILA